MTGILFKHDRDRIEWERHPKNVEYNEIANRSLKRLVYFINALCLLFGWGPVVVTSYWRPGDTDSYHSIFQAADLRLKDKPEKLKYVLIAIQPVLHWVDPNLQIYLHTELWGQAQEHIHVAYKDGSLKRD